MPDFSYDSTAWHSLSASFLASADGCVIGRLAGGGCRGPLHAHHVYSVEERPDLALDEENLLAICECHHPMLEAFRRLLRRAVGERTLLPPCPHRHPYAEGRRACERRRARELGIALDDLAAAAA